MPSLPPVFIDLSAFRPDGGNFGPEMEIVENLLPAHAGHLSLQKKQEISRVVDGPMRGAYVHIYQQTLQLQTSGPTSDGVIGAWIAQGGSGASLFNKVDETIPDDNDFIAALGAPSQTVLSNGAVLRLPETIVDPTSAIDHYYRWRYRIPSTTGAWTVTVYLTDSPFTISTVTRAGATATVTTSAVHGLTGTLSIVIDGVSVAAYNGLQTCTVTGVSTFTFTVAGTPANGTGGTYRTVWASDAASGAAAVSSWTQREKLLTAGEANAILTAAYGRLRLMIVAVVAGAAQFGRPSADNSIGGWETQAGATTNLYQTIDETPASDTDYIASPVLALGGAAAIYGAALSALVDPLTDAGFTLRLRIRGANSGVQVIARLKQGSTTIKATTYTNIATSFATQTISLSSGEWALVTDPAALVFEIETAWPSAVTSTVSQESGPISDDDTGWTPSSGASCTAMIDEASPSDADFISAGILGITFTMGALDDPGTDADHVLKIRAKTTNTGDSLYVRLISGGALVRLWDFGGGVGIGPLTSSFQTFNLTLTTGEAALLAYGDIEVSLEAYGSGGGAGVNVSWLRFFVPEQRWAELSFVELEGPSPARAEISWTQLQIPGVTAAYKGDVPTIFSGSRTKLYEVTPASFVDRSKGGGYAVGAEPGWWHFASVGNQVIATNRSDPVQLRLDNAGAFQDCITSTLKPKARFCAASRGFLFLGDINLVSHTPDEIWWSYYQNVRDFDNAPQGQGGFQRLVSTPGQLMGLVGGDYVTAFKRNSMHLVGWQGGQIPWRVDDITAATGTPCPNSIIQTPYGILFYDGSTFRRYAGGLGDDAVADISNGILSQFLSDPAFSAIPQASAGLNAGAVAGALALVEPADIYEEERLMVGWWDPFARLAFWTYQSVPYWELTPPIPGLPQELQLVTPAPAKHIRGIAYNPREDRWGIIRDTALFASCWASMPNVTSAASHLLKGSMGFSWEEADVSSAWFQFSGSNTYQGFFRSKVRALGIEEAPEGQRSPMAVRLTGLLPVFSRRPERSAPPDISVTVYASNDPWYYGDIRSKTNSVSNANAQGIIPVDITGTWFLIEATIPEMTLQEARGFRGFYAFSDWAGTPGGR